VAIGAYTPGGTGAYLNFTTWLKTFFVPSYEKMVLIPRITDGGRLYGGAYFRTFDRLTSATLSTSSVGNNDDLTWQSGSPSRGSVTPASYYIAVAYNDAQKDEVESDIGAPIRQNVEDCAAEACDAVACAALHSLTNTFGAGTYHPELAGIRAAIGRLRINSKGAVDVRDGALQGVFTPAVEPDLLSIPEMTQAQYRGDGENPLVKGFFSKGSGINWNYTTAITNSNGYGNAVFDPSALLIMWNTHPRAEKQRDGVANLLISYANFGVAVARNERGYLIKSVGTIDAP
jgi:hypothetical protein